MFEVELGISEWVWYDVTPPEMVKYGESGGVKEYVD